MLNGHSNLFVHVMACDGSQIAHHEMHQRAYTPKV